MAATIDLRDLRLPAGLMLGVAAVLPALPGHPGVACPLRALTGVPCPLCGMTTSVEDAVHLDLRAAAAANPAGIAAVLVALWLLLVRPRAISVPLGVRSMVLGAMWLFELHRFGFI